MKNLPSIYNLLGTTIILLCINFVYFKHDRFMNYPRFIQSVVWMFLIVILTMVGVIVLNTLFLT